MLREELRERSEGEVDGTKKGKAAKSAGAVGGAAARSARSPYVQRLIEDEELRDNIQAAFEAARDAYARMANGKGPAKALMDDKKVHKDLQRGRRDPEGGLRPAPRQEAEEGPQAWAACCCSA